MLTTGVHANRPASRGTPRTTSKLYLGKKGAHTYVRSARRPRQVTARATKTEKKCVRGATTAVRRQ
uniref:Uncharacterized protein n=1 Tax=Arundo donax TaxID=35708 RepID=A0A0A9ESJ0_ARUDO